MVTQGPTQPPFGGFTPDPPGPGSTPSTGAVSTPYSGAPSGSMGQGFYSPPGSSVYTGGQSPTGASWAGGGWTSDQAPPGSPQAVLGNLFSQGVTGQAAVDQANRLLGLQPPNSISFSNGQYGLPGGYYITPNPSNPNAMDLISRGSGGGGGGANGAGPFTMPSLADAQNYPGYQFAFDQGQRAVQSSAAAKGDLLTGGTLKDLAQFGTGLAANTYGQLFNEALAANQTNNGYLMNLANLGKPS